MPRLLESSYCDHRDSHCSNSTKGRTKIRNVWWMGSSCLSVPFVLQTPRSGNTAIQHFLLRMLSQRDRIHELCRRVPSRSVVPAPLSSSPVQCAPDNCSLLGPPRLTPNIYLFLWSLLRILLSSKDFALSIAGPILCPFPVKEKVTSLGILLLLSKPSYFFS